MLLLALVAGMANALCAQTADEYFMLGNNAYKKGDFARAAENYEFAIKDGLDGAAAHFNLANSYAKLDAKGPALLNYMKAFAQSPRSPEIAAKLEIFSRDNSLDSGLSKFPSALMYDLSDFEWTLAAFVSFWAAVLLFVLPPLFGGRTAVTIFLSLICAAIFAVSAYSLSGWRSFLNSAVALKPDTALLLSPVANAPVNAIVSDGQIAEIKNRKDGFVYAETPNGKAGWVCVKDLAPVSD